MIFDTIVNILLLPVEALFNALPSSSGLGLNTFASNVVGSSFFPHLGWANDYFPLDQLVTAVTLILATMATMFIVNIGLWIYHQFPTVGGGNG